MLGGAGWGATPRRIVDSDGEAEGAPEPWAMSLVPAAAASDSEDMSLEESLEDIAAGDELVDAFMDDAEDSSPQPAGRVRSDREWAELDQGRCKCAPH